jgi:hypothetical protein
VRERISPRGWTTLDGLCHRQAQTIYIRAKAPAKKLKGILLHEMAHAVTDGGHSDAWQAEIKRLHLAGAPVHRADLKRFPEMGESDNWPYPIPVTKETVRSCAREFLIEGGSTQTVQKFLRWFVNENACGQPSVTALLSAYPWVPCVFHQVIREYHKIEFTQQRLRARLGIL